MGLPFSRNTSYNPNTPVASVDLDDLQDWQVRGWDAHAGKDYLLVEDFNGALGNTLFNQLAGANSVQADDSANDGFGVLSLPPAAGAHETWDGPAMPLNGRRWRLAIRMRWHALPASANSNCFIGLFAAVGPTPLLWKATGGAGAVWQLSRPGGTDVTTVAVGTGYHVFELRADGANISAAIDGTAMITVAQPSPFNAKLHIDVFRNGADAANELRVDAMRFWCAR